MDSISKYIFLLNVKRGMKWSERKIEINNETLQYFNPKDNELRFKSLISDIIIEEKNANNPKKYRIKLSSKTGKFKLIKLCCDDYTTIQKFKIKFDEIIKNINTLNNLKNKNIIAKSQTLPINDSTIHPSILEKINESEIPKQSINTTIGQNITNPLDSKSNVEETHLFDPRKSLLTNVTEKDKDEPDNGEIRRKGKNIVDKYKYSLPKELFKKREFVVEKSKINETENDNERNENVKIEENLNGKEELNKIFDEELSKIILNKNSLFEQNIGALAESIIIENRIDEKENICKQNNRDFEDEQLMNKSVMIEEKSEVDLICKWKPVKYSKNCSFEYNGDNLEILNFSKRNFRKIHKNKFIEFAESRNKHFEYNKTILRSSIFLTGLILLVAFSACSYTNFIGLLLFVVVFYLKILNVRKLFEIEKKFEKNSSVKSRETEKNTVEKLKSKGTLIRINSLFNLDKNLIEQILNDFNNYSIFDKNVTKSDNDNDFNINELGNNGLNTLFYSLNLEEKRKCMKFKRGKCSNEKNEEKEEETHLIKREIIKYGQKNNTLFIDYIKDRDQKEKVLRIFYIENINDNSTLISLLLPVDYYLEVSDIESEINKKRALFNSSLKFLDNIHKIISNKLYFNSNNCRKNLENLDIFSQFLNTRIHSKQLKTIQSDISNTILFNFVNEQKKENNNPENPTNLKQGKNFIDEILDAPKSSEKATISNNPLILDDKLNIDTKNFEEFPDPSRKSTMQKFSEIGNRYSFTGNDNLNDSISLAKLNNTYICPENKDDFNLDKINSNMNNIEYPDLSLNNPYENYKDNNGSVENKIQIEEIKVDPELKKENDEVFSLLDKKFSELDSFLNRDWKILEEKDSFVSYYLDEKSGLRSIKSKIVINKNMHILSDYLDDLNKRGTYDKNFDHGKILRIIDDEYSIRYLKFKGKIMISPRDFIIAGRRIIKNDQIIVLITSFESPKYQKNKGIERADMKIAGFILKKIDENSTDVTNFVSSDLKLSQMLVNTSLKEIAQSVRVLKDILK